MTEALRIAPGPALRRWAKQHGHSAEALARWDAFYPDVFGLVEALAKPPVRFLRLNPLRDKPERTLQRLKAKGFTLAETPLPLAYRIDEAPISAGATVEYLRGAYTLQDLSAQLAVPCLEPKPGMRVADLGAAPGGKTLQLAQALDRRGVIHAFEPDARRHGSLVSNLDRCGAVNVVAHHATGQSAADSLMGMDAVLLDAPCTGEGVIQRDPTRRRIHLKEYETCAREQGELMAAAAQILRPGGILIYSTCTLAPEENELQVAQAAADHDLTIEALPTAIADVKLEGSRLLAGLQELPESRLPEAIKHTMHTLPHMHGCLGFYVARLRKEGP